MTTIVPPSTIGMLGGGQLGRYALIAARQMGFATVVLDPDPLAPAGAVADRHLVANFDDADALENLCNECSVITTEFENPPRESLDVIALRLPVRPSPSAIAVAQDRQHEKQFLTAHGFEVGPYVNLDGGVMSDVEPLLPGIVKTARLGYDGRGQTRVSSVDEVSGAVARLGDARCVLERRLNLVVEISVIVARSVGGETVTWPASENHHVDGVLDFTVVPARVPDGLLSEADQLARQIAMALDYVGVLAVEMFVIDSDGGHRLLVNELAPRPHNSGHWTLDASFTDQFTQQIRSITGSALASTAMTVPAVAMVNLLGDLWESGEPDWSAAQAESRARVHLYGKATARPGRKMGHLTVVGEEVDQVADQARALRAVLSRS